MLNLQTVESVVLDALKNAPEAIVIYDKDGYLVVCNRNFRQLYGYTEDQAKPGTHYRNLVQIDRENGNIPTGCSQSDDAECAELRPGYRHHEKGPFEFELGSGRWISINERPTSYGGIIRIQRDITERKKTEKTLLQTNELFRVAFNANNISCAISELETGKFLDVNTAWCDQMGISKEDVIGKTAAELNIWGSPAARVDLLKKIRETPSIQNFENQFRNQKDEYRNFLLNIEVIFIDGVECLFISSRDITENKRTEKAKEISEHRFQVMFENALLGMALVDSSTNLVLSANQKYLDIVGASDKNINSIDWRDITHPEDLAEDLDKMRQLNSGLIAGYVMEKRYVHSDGSISWVELFVHDVSYHDGSEKRQHFVMLLDITKKKEAELELEVSRDRFANFTKASTDWYWETDKELRLTYISPGIYKSTGLAENEYIGRTQQEILAASAPRQEVLEYLYDQFKARKGFRDLVFYRKNHKTGTPVWVRMSGQPYYDDSGTFLGFRGSSSDITTQRELEEKLHQSQKMEAVGQLTGGVAHDFNNLLAVIQGNVELVAEALDEGRPVQSSQLKPVLRAARRGAELTQSMLAFSRIQELSPAVLRLDSHVSRMVDMLHRTLGEAIAINTDFEEDLWYCDADPGKIENALLNLCLNARDAMPDGGILSIAVENAELDQDYVAAQTDVKPGKYVVLSINDTGCGIDQQELERVIEPFYTTKEIGKGTGLGLSMVYGFARQSRGHLAIFSEVGVGTTVKLYLPYAEEKDAFPNSNCKSEVSIGSGTILVVEDDKDVREITVSQLEVLGYTVLVAADGTDAADVLDKCASSIDILLTDAILPGKLSGIGIVQLALSKNEAMKVIVMTGYDGRIFDPDMQNNPEIVHLQKPFRKAQLASTIQQAMLRKAS